MKASFEVDGVHVLDVEGNVPRHAGSIASVQVSLRKRPLPFSVVGSCDSTGHASLENVVAECPTPDLPQNIPAVDSVLLDPRIVWYGPHACGICGQLIIKAARAQGGAEYNAPSGPVYPNTRYERHVHQQGYYPGEAPLFSAQLKPSQARALASAILSAATEAKG